MPSCNTCNKCGSNVQERKNNLVRTSRTNERTNGTKRRRTRKRTAAALEDQETPRTMLLRETRKYGRNERFLRVRSAIKRRANRDERLQSKRNPGDTPDVTERTMSIGPTKNLRSTLLNKCIHPTHDPHFSSGLTLGSPGISTLLSACRNHSCRPMPM